MWSFVYFLSFLLPRGNLKFNEHIICNPPNEKHARNEFSDAVDLPCLDEEFWIHENVLKCAVLKKNKSENYHELKTCVTIALKLSRSRLAKRTTNEKLSSLFNFLNIKQFTAPLIHTIILSHALSLGGKSLSCTLNLNVTCLGHWTFQQQPALTGLWHLAYNLQRLHNQPWESSGVLLGTVNGGSIQGQDEMCKTKVD